MKSYPVQITVALTLLLGSITIAHAQIIRGDNPTTDTGGYRRGQNSGDSPDAKPPHQNDPSTNTRGSNYSDQPGGYCGNGGKCDDGIINGQAPRGRRPSTGPCHPSEPNCCPTNDDESCSNQVIGTRCAVTAFQRGTCRVLPKTHQAGCFCSPNRLESSVY